MAGDGDGPGEIPVYDVLVSGEPGLGTWVKIPEFGQQMLTDDVDFGLGQPGELVSSGLDRRRKRGEYAPECLRWKTREVTREEYGTTAVEGAGDEWDGEDE